LAICGGIVVINFADMTWRIALTADFSTLASRQLLWRDVRCLQIRAPPAVAIHR
jgi:hypothetical protein